MYRVQTDSSLPRNPEALNIEPQPQPQVSHSSPDTSVIDVTAQRTNRLVQPVFVKRFGEPETLVELPEIAKNG